MISRMIDCGRLIGYVTVDSVPMCHFREQNHLKSTVDSSVNTEISKPDRIDQFAESGGIHAR